MCGVQKFDTVGNEIIGGGGGGGWVTTKVEDVSMEEVDNGLGGMCWSEAEKVEDEVSGPCERRSQGEGTVRGGSVRPSDMEANVTVH